MILRAQQRDADAFSILVERRWSYLVRFARSIVGEADAEDVVQDGLLRAWDKLPRLRAAEAFPFWIVRIVSRFCFRRARRRRSMVPLSTAPEPFDPGSEGRLEAIHVENILSALAPRQRAVMHLTLIEGMSDSEISTALGITAASVRSHRRRAREAVFRLLPASKAKGEFIS